MDVYPRICRTAHSSDDASPTPVADQIQFDDTVNLKGGSTTASISYTSGGGELKYHRGSHRFAIHGLSEVDVGATDYSAADNDYYSTRPAYFEGTYVAARASVAVAGDASAGYLETEHGGVGKRVSTDVGPNFTLPAEGVCVSLNH